MVRKKYISVSTRFLSLCLGLFLFYLIIFIPSNTTFATDNKQEVDENLDWNPNWEDDTKTEKQADNKKNIVDKSKTDQVKSSTVLSSPEKKTPVAPEVSGTKKESTGKVSLDAAKSISQKTTEDTAKPKLQGEFLDNIGNIGNILSGHKKPVGPPANIKSIANPCTLDEAIPSDVLVLLRTASIKELDVNGKFLISKLGFGMLSPMEWLKLTKIASCLPWINQDKEIGIFLYGENGTYGRVFLLPVHDYRGFLKPLGADIGHSSNPIPDKTFFALNLPKGWFAYTWRGYVGLVEPELKNYLGNFVQEPFLYQTEKSGLAALKEPLLSLEIYSEGIQQLSLLRTTLTSQNRSWLNQLLRSFQSPNTIGGTNVNSTSEGNIIAFIEMLKRDIRYLRLDLVLRTDSLITSITCLPVENSAIDSQIKDQSSADIPVDLGLASFLKVVPSNLRTPVSGQIDMTKTSAQTLDPPFDRLRHIEYALILPQYQEELLAESWCFFLEVDDSEAFIQELILPKAYELGSFEGSEKLGDLGARILGNLSVRRQGRGPLLGRMDPNKAAALGKNIGSQLGSSIGRSIGEKTAMKIYDFQGYRMVISDLEMYTRKKREMDAKKAGLIPRTPIYLTGERTLMSLIANMASGLQSGSLDTNFGNIINSYSGTTDYSTNAPLMARKNMILVLDSRHLLIVPGDESVLSQAVENWEIFRNKYLEAVPEGTSYFLRRHNPIKGNFKVNWQNMRDAIMEETIKPEDQILRSITQLDLFATKQMVEYIRNHYLPQIPPLPIEKITTPLSTSVVISSTTDWTLEFYLATPYDTIMELCKLYINPQKPVQPMGRNMGQNK